MDFFTLGPSHQPDKLFENYDSLVWSERYSRYGDFELVSANVQATMSALPLETIVSIRESTVPMIVEQIKIASDKTSGSRVTVSGRSFETVLDRRSAVSTLPAETPRLPWTVPASKPSDAAYLAIRKVIGDVSRTVPNEIIPAIPESELVSPLDAIPGIDLPPPADYTPARFGIPEWVPSRAYEKGFVVLHNDIFYRALVDIEAAESDPPNVSSRWVIDNTNPDRQNFEIRAADLYTTVIEMLNTNHHGLKAVRPPQGGSKISLEIYNGADLTNALILEAKHDQLENPTTLLSYRDSSNVAYVYGANGAQIVQKNAGPPPSGLSRRVMTVDEMAEGVLTTEELRISRGLVELYKRNTTALYDGEASYKVAQGYNRDYYLGDIITLIGEYGGASPVRVEEFIRTKDASGEKAYPTFEVVSEF